ncbi:hypothetical protein ACXR2U_08725 [Jatrophihabitans sp. YIM 134969]
MTAAWQRPLTALGVVGGSAVVVWGVLLATADAAAPGTSPLGKDLIPFLLCAGLVGLSVVSYIPWPSRWNVPAHAQLAFALIAYVLPIFGLHILDDASPTIVNLYTKVIVVGFLFAAFGTILGAVLGNAADLRPTLSRWVARVEVASLISPPRILILGFVAVGGMLVSFSVMGFIPAFAADPFAAKFFKGEYAAAYAPVAPLYRFCTTVLAVILPLLALYAWRRRTPAYISGFAAALVVMLISLQRDPAVSGVLVCAGVLIAFRASGMSVYFLVLVGVYVLGSGLYYLLASVGLSAFTQGPAVSTSWLQQIAAGSPDVHDQLGFLTAWTSRPSYTHGLTWVGGLVPGNFRWNPSVWSLGVVNPTQSISSINSGGLRLPAPIWGLVSFGWPGVIIVSFVSGVLTGLTTAILRRIVAQVGPGGALLAVVVYLAVADVIPVFFRLSYLSVIGALVLLATAFWVRSSGPSVRGDAAVATRTLRGART